jgi:DNA-directed RNA polymerase, sigma subunit (sigma70/sigma32)
MADELRINLYKITRGACRKLPGPCPHAMCRFNLTTERRDNRGAKPAQIHLPVVREACALEAAEQGGMTLEEIAMRLSLTRERVRQIELGALKKLWAHLGADEGEREGAQPAAGFRRPSRIAA